MTEPATLPPRASYDAELEAFATDSETLRDQPDQAVANCNKSLDSMSWWDHVVDWFKDIAGSVQEKINAFCTEVAKFFTTIADLDQGDPYAIYAAGEGYLKAQQTFSGLDTSFKAWNLKALNDWDGSTGAAYAASVPVQAAAVARLATWCGSAGSVLMNHSRGVVEAFIRMRLTMQTTLNELVSAVTSLAVVDPTKLGATIEKIIALAAKIVTAVETLKAAFESWANQSLRSIDAIKVAMANQTGTDGGAWPDFIRA